MRLLALALLAGCQGPDRWHTSVARSNGDAASDYGKLDFETEATTLEVGISGPLWARENVTARPEPMPEYTPTTIPATSGGAGLPWMELLLLLGGAAGWEGSKRGYQRVRRPKG